MVLVTNFVADRPGVRSAMPRRGGGGSSGIRVKQRAEHRSRIDDGKTFGIAGLLNVRACLALRLRLSLGIG